MKYGFYGRWVEEGPDSPDQRKKVVQALAEEVGAVRLRPNDVELEVSAVGPRFVVGDSEITAGPYRPLPTGRAKAVLELAYSQEDLSSLDRCLRFHEDLDDALQRLQVGHVDGNDIGQGLVRIYCFGPSKQPLVEAIRAAAHHAELLNWRLLT